MNALVYLFSIHCNIFRCLYAYAHLAAFDSGDNDFDVVTDVDKDGMLRGPNIDLLREVCSRTDRPVIASGGVSSLDDLAALRDIVPHGLEGAIIGRALYDGAFTLPAALDVAGQ